MYRVFLQTNHKMNQSDDEHYDCSTPIVERKRDEAFVQE